MLATKFNLLTTDDKSIDNFLYGEIPRKSSNKVGHSKSTGKIKLSRTIRKEQNKN